MQDDIPKQRGIYSEILTTEDTENLKVSENQSLSNNFIPSARVNYRSKQGEFDRGQYQAKNPKSKR